jgi:fatty acid desaturase
VKRTPIPNSLNLLLLTAASVAACLWLWAASHCRGPVVWLFALLFSYTNHTLYALLHEAVHGVFHSNRRVNDWAGRWAAAFFPTSYRLQRAFHLTHHRYNRTRSEQWDYLRPADSRFLKLAQWYAILTGFYWLFVPLASLLYLLWPGLLHTRLMRDSASARQTASDVYLAALDRLDGRLARQDVLFAVGLQLTLWTLLSLDLKGWLICYAAFAFNWSSLQYADHAFSPLDVKNGAWNLRTHPWVRALLLNYPLHRAHHQHPQASWVHLPRLVDPEEEPQPSYLENWLRMWKGPRRLPETVDEPTEPLDLPEP